MTPQYFVTISPDEQRLLAEIAKSQIQEICLAMRLPDVTHRGDRDGFRRCTELRLRADQNYVIFSRPKTALSGYDEFVIGIRDERDLQLDADWQLFARKGANSTESQLGSASLESAIKAALVRITLPLTRDGQVLCTHRVDAGVLFSAEASERILILTHRSQTWVIEISTLNAAIDRELATLELVPLN